MSVQYSLVISITYKGKKNDNYFKSKALLRNGPYGPIPLLSKYRHLCVLVQIVGEKKKHLV